MTTWTPSQRAVRRGARFGPRAGLSLMEIMVVIAILVVVSGVFMVGVSGVMMLEQRALARKLAVNYELLHDEAVLQNVTFRVDYHVDEGFIEVKAGSPETLIFDDADDREEYEDDQEELARREGDEAAARDDFTAIQTSLVGKLEIPNGTVISGFYSPQYGEDLVEVDLDERESRLADEEPLVFSSYIFPNGFTEHVIVHITDDDDLTQGWSVEVEPLSGRVHLRDTLVTPDDSYDWLPSEAPRLD